MTLSEAYQFLNRGRGLKHEIELLTKQIMEAEALAEKITSSLSGMPGSPSKDPHKFDRVVELTDVRISRKNQLKRTLVEIEQTISLLSDSNQRQVLSMFYVDGLSMDRIAMNMNYSIENVYVIRRKGVRALRDIMSTK